MDVKGYRVDAKGYKVDIKGLGGAVARLTEVHAGRPIKTHQVFGHPRNMEGRVELSSGQRSY